MKTFQAIISHNDHGAAVFCPELNLYTCADSEFEAKAQFGDLLIEYFEFLVEHRGKLSEPLARHLEIYKQAILGKGVKWDPGTRTRLAK